MRFHQRLLQSDFQPWRAFGILFTYAIETTPHTLMPTREVSSLPQQSTKGDFMSQLRETFVDELKDLYDAEKQITKALPKMAKAAEHQDLKDAFESHLEETKKQIERLEEVFEQFDETAKGKHCKGMEGLLAEGEELIKEDEGDAALICAAQKVEHYEIAAYGSLASWARLLGEEEASSLLEESLQEEKQADEKLTEIAENAINVEESEGDEEGGQQRSTPKLGGRRRAGRSPSSRRAHASR
jgi:ferritin-like metal-binding protein YciE